MATQPMHLLAITVDVPVIMQSHQICHRSIGYMRVQLYSVLCDHVLLMLLNMFLVLLEVHNVNDVLLERVNDAVRDDYRNVQHVVICVGFATTFNFVGLHHRVGASQVAVSYQTGSVRR